jgi:hypothetical protein
MDYVAKRENLPASLIQEKIARGHLNYPWEYRASLSRDQQKQDSVL